MKNRTFRRIGGVIISLWVLAFLGILAVLAFPGMKSFYWRSKLDPDILARVGNAYEFSLRNPAGWYDPESMLILENGRVLNRTFSSNSLYEQDGTFFNESDDQKLQGFFIPSATVRSGTQSGLYQFLVKPKLISGLNAGRVALFLTLGLVVLFIMMISGRNIRGSQGVTPKVNALANKYLRVQRIGTENDPLPPWGIVFIRSFTIFFWAGFLLIISEWLFFATKSSFMSFHPWPERFGVFLAAFIIFSLAILAVFLLFQFIGFLLSRVTPTLAVYLSQLPLALLCASLVMILIDNFTYSIFLAGIAGSTPLVRLLLALSYGLVFLFILNRSVLTVSRPSGTRTHSPWFYALIGLLLVSGFTAGFKYKQDPSAQLPREVNAAGENAPNIILISSDGIEAQHFSVYGYERDTTPFLRELGKDSLIGENAYSNSGHTLGSYASVLTGRSPLATRVLFSPDILQGTDRDLHLPGILRNAGYKTVSLGVPFYADATATNFQRAFDEINCLPAKGTFSKLGYITPGLGNGVYLLSTIEQRIYERLNHIFFVSNFRSPIQSVNETSGYLASDRERIKCLNSYLEESASSGQPVFAQIHLMGTHGPMFEISVPRFSEGQSQDRTWMTDFYDDTILNFDLELSTLASRLRTLGIYENTIIVVYSDHGQSWTATSRLPLIFHFPNNEHAGLIKENTQNLDIAPTILDYLGIEIPGWMDGNSLLTPLDGSRPIYTFDPLVPVQEVGLWVNPSNAAENNYDQFGMLHAIVCDHIISVDLTTAVVSQSLLEETAHSCVNAGNKSMPEIIAGINEFLVRSGFPQLTKNP